MSNYEGPHFDDNTEAAAVAASDAAYSTPNTPYQKQFAEEFGHNSHVYRHDTDGSVTRVSESDAMLDTLQSTEPTNHSRERTKLYVDDDGREFSTVEEKRRAQDLRSNWSVEKEFTFGGAAKLNNGIEKGTEVVQLRTTSDGSQTTLLSREQAEKYGVIGDDIEVLSQPFTYGGATKRKDGIAQGDTVERIRKPDGSTDIRKTSRRSERQRSGAQAANDAPTQPTESPEAVSDSGLSINQQTKAATRGQIAAARAEEGLTEQEWLDQSGYKGHLYRQKARAEAAATTNDGLDSVRELEKVAQDSLDLIERRNQASPEYAQGTVESLNAKLEEIMDNVHGEIAQANTDVTELFKNLKKSDPDYEVKLTKLLATTKALRAMVSQGEEAQPGAAASPNETLTENDEQDISRLARFGNSVRSFFKMPIQTTQQAMVNNRNRLNNAMDDLRGEKDAKRKAKAALVLGGYAVIGAALAGGAAYGVYRATREGDAETANSLADAARDGSDYASENIADNAQSMAEQAQRADTIAAAREATAAAKEAAVEGATTIAPEVQDKIDAAREAAEAFSNQPEFVIEQGNGFTHEIMDFAQTLGRDLEGEKAYSIYEQLVDTFGKDGILLDTTTYEMANGDIGIGSSGVDKWAPGVAEFIESRL